MTRESFQSNIRRTNFMAGNKIFWIIFLKSLRGSHDKLFNSSHLQAFYRISALQNALFAVESHFAKLQFFESKLFRKDTVAILIRKF